MPALSLVVVIHSFNKYVLAPNYLALRIQQRKKHKIPPIKLFTFLQEEADSKQISKKNTYCVGLQSVLQRKEKQKKVRVGVAMLKWVVQEGLTEKMTFHQRSEAGERTSHDADLREEQVQRPWPFFK